MDNQKIISAAWDVINQARNEYIELDHGDAHPRIAQKLNDVAYAHCERVCSIMLQVIEKAANKEGKT